VGERLEWRCGLGRPGRRGRASRGPRGHGGLLETDAVLFFVRECLGVVPLEVSVHDGRHGSIIAHVRYSTSAIPCAFRGRPAGVSAPGGPSWARPADSDKVLLDRYDATFAASRVAVMDVMADLEDENLPVADLSGPNRLCGARAQAQS
jgi:hypothetical protein